MSARRSTALCPPDDPPILFVAALCKSAAAWSEKVSLFGSCLGPGFDVVSFVVFGGFCFRFF